MNTQKNIFIILLAILICQVNVFAADKDSNEPDGLAQLVEDDKWGEPNNGFATQLIPQSEDFIVGKPMNFGLVLKNVSNSVKEYDRQVFITCCGSLMVRTIDNNELYDKKGPYQTAGGMQPIEAGEIVTLFENRDITDEYVIMKPGKYIIQSRRVPASNVIEFEVKPGTPDERDLLISSLVKIIPDASWRVVAPKRRDAHAELKEEVIAVVLARGGKMDGIGVMLRQTKLQGTINDRRQNPPPLEYLGKNDSDYFYISIPPKALDYWPKIKEDISKALKIENQSEQNNDSRGYVK